LALKQADCDNSPRRAFRISFRFDGSQQIEEESITLLSFLLPHPSVGIPLNFQRQKYRFRFVEAKRLRHQATAVITIIVILLKKAL